MFAQGGTLLLIDTAYGHGADSVTRPEAVFFVPGETPVDWLNPVDYARGTVSFRIQVRVKPTLTALRLQPCLEQTLAQGGGRSCASAETLSDTGTYTWSAPLSQWEPAMIWPARPARIVIILQDAYGKPVKPGAAGWVGQPYASLYYPLQVRFSTAITPVNGTFPGWEALLPTALNARKVLGPGLTLYAAGQGAVSVRFAPARPIGAELRCWDSRGKLRARAAWRALPGDAPFTLTLPPESATGPLWAELRAGSERWTTMVGTRP